MLAPGMLDSLLVGCSPGQRAVAFFMIIGHREADIAKILGISRSRVGQIRRRLAERALAVLQDKPIKPAPGTLRAVDRQGGRYVKAVT